jgi:acyl carrier protein
MIKDQYIIIKTMFLSGINNLKTVSPNSTLSELGMDSMTLVEIKQSLEREFGVFLMPKEIRSLTFARLSEMAEKTQKPEGEEQPSQGTQVLFLSGNYLCTELKSESFSDTETGFSNRTEPNTSPETLIAVYIFMDCFFNIHFNITPPSVPSSHK